MAESQKVAASTSKSQKNNSLLDEEIGKEFLSSWKSMSMMEDDVLGFNCETIIPKAKGKAFNFDKMDMDFSLDGDFGKKISSFKVDMSDLDLASPSKKLVKPKEGTRQESSGGKLEGKQDSFTFSFNFDELENFDLGSSMMKGEKTSDKVVSNKRSDSPVKHAEKQESTSKLVTSNVQIENEAMNKLGALEHVSSKFECLTGAIRNLDLASDGFPSITKNFGNSNASHGKNAPPHKETTDSTNGVDQYSKQSQIASSIETNDQGIKSSSVRPAIGVDANQGFVQELEVDICSSATEVNTSPEGEQDNGGRQIAGLDAKLLNSTPLEGSPLTCIARSQTNAFKKLENRNDAPLGYKQGKESVQYDKNMASVSQKMPDIPMPTLEKKSSCSRLPPTQLLSGPEVHTRMLWREKGSSNICLKFLKGSEVRGSQLNKTSMPKKACALNDKINQLKNTSMPEKACTLRDKRNESMHQSPAVSRQDIDAGNMKVGNQKTRTLNSSGSSATEGAPDLLGNLKKNEDNKASAGFQVHAVGSPKKATKISALKCINFDLHMPSIALTKTFKSNSVEEKQPSPLEAGKKALHISDLKVLRSIAPNNDPLTHKVQKDIKSQWQSEGNNAMHVNAAGKMVHSISADSQRLSSHSMKRKMPEELNAYQMIQHPLKRITDLPNETRKPLEALEKDKKQVASPNNKKQVSESENLLETYHSTSLLNAPRDACLTELKVPLPMKIDGNVQKAEACAKELEDICNMLKKKQEEAKELLVRAIVNNNNLLILNHPMNKDKICNVQKFAAQMISRKLSNVI